MPKKIASLPLNRIHASAYPAIDATKIGMIVAGIVMASEFTRGMAKPPWPVSTSLYPDRLKLGWTKNSHHPVVAAASLDRNELTNRPNVGIVQITPINTAAAEAREPLNAFRTAVTAALPVSGCWTLTGGLVVVVIGSPAPGAAGGCCSRRAAVSYTHLTLPTIY